MNRDFAQPTRPTRRRPVFGLGVLWAFILLLAMAGVGCVEESAPRSDAPEQTVPAAVAMAQSYHVQADLAVEDGNLDEAERLMRELIAELETLRDNREVRELGIDAYTRLARIQVDQGALENALATTDRGLEFGGDVVDESIFGGYLYQTRGNIQRELGDDKGTVESHKRAIMVFKALIEAERGAEHDPDEPR